MIDPRPSDIFKTGEILNNTYEIEGVVGRGGLGEVYRVRNTVTGRTFAIKALNAQFSGNADYVELMKREEEVRSIIHDSVVRYNECSRTDDGHVILVMDYVAGPSLADAMMSRQVSERELLVIAHRIAQGLEAAHAKGIVHRDLSPDNIILRDGAPEAATLIDFGIAKDTSDGAKTIVGNEFAGKYEYAAPEQVEGKAEARSDLYALGATLLAAYRGETPFLGSTPGEIVRNKQAPLDFDGVPDRLRLLVEALSAPSISDRPADASAAVALVEGLLSDARDAVRSGPQKKSKVHSQKTRSKRQRGYLLVAACIFVIGLGGFFAMGAWRSLPVVTPYTLSMTKAVSGRTMLDAHAPDEATADALVASFVAATGAPPEAAQVVLAAGMPGPSWASSVTELVSMIDDLERWELAISDNVASLTGLATNRDVAESVNGSIENWKSTSGFQIDVSLAIGPEVLSGDTIRSTLSALQNCGPLNVDGNQFDRGDTIEVTGSVAQPSDVDRLKQTLEGIVGSRPIEISVRVLSPHICAIRSILPAVDAGAASIRLSNGEDGSPNLAGAFRAGENPVVELLVPESSQDLFVWAMLVDTTGRVFHVLPNISEQEFRLANLGVVESGVRRITLLHPISVREQEENKDKLVLKVDPENFGKNEIVVVLSEAPLFEARRPTGESVAALKEALTETLVTRQDAVRNIVTRVIETRE